MINQRYDVLDGLRGVAAIAVVAFHTKDLLGFKPESAYLAVDFFFVLSGFVLAYAYDQQLGAKLSGFGFFRKRIIRLFPLYLTGSAITFLAASVAVFIAHDANQWTPAGLLMAGSAALVMMPSFVNFKLFPLNDPSWSLFFEFIANGAYGARLFHGWLVWLVPALAAIGLLAEVVICGSMDQGAVWGDPWWTTLLWGAFRVLYSFPAGLLLYRYREAIRLPRLSFVWLALLLALVLCANPSGIWRQAFDLSFVLLGSPLIVGLGASSQTEDRYQMTLCSFFGAISYPIYVLHQPIEDVYSGALHRFSHVSIEGKSWIGMALIAALIVISAVAYKADVFARRNWLV